MNRSLVEGGVTWEEVVGDCSGSGEKVCLAFLSLFFNLTSTLSGLGWGEGGRRVLFCYNAACVYCLLRFCPLSVLSLSSLCPLSVLALQQRFVSLPGERLGGG